MILFFHGLKIILFKAKHIALKAWQVNNSLTTLSGIVENCHLKSQILPQNYENFATKIEKFATFYHKNWQILQIKCTNWRTFYRFRRPGILHWSEMHTKSHSGAYQKEKMIKNINLILKKEYQNLQREAWKFRKPNKYSPSSAESEKGLRRTQ